VTVIFPIISLYFFTTLIISAISGRSALAFSSPQLCRGSSLTLKPGTTSDTLDSFEIDSHRRAFQNNMSKPKISRHYDSKLMSTAPLSGITAFAGVIIGGVIGGALHAISGPDHIAALLPRCCGQRWYRAGRAGALWGVGHGFSATLIGLCAFGLKKGVGSATDIFSMMEASASALEVAVGFSLILIGILGIREAREWEEEIEVSPKSLSSAAADPGTREKPKRALIFNGILHGFSLDGVPSLAPALAVSTWRGSISFLLAYGIGTIGVMTIATMIIGESTRKAGEVLNRPQIPQKLSFISSILAITVGAIWCYLGLK